MMTKTYSQVSRIAIIVGGSIGIATGAAAQDSSPPDGASEPGGVQDIVVTATRRSQSIRDIPASISALSQEQLQEAGALQAKDVARLVPGFAYTEVNSGQAVLAVRGVQTSAVFGNVQQPVALYYDDVPVLDLTIPWTVPRLQLFDAERVEVLRGPQGTLFGAGALSGAVRVINNKPDTTKVEAAAEGVLTSTKHGGIGGSLNMMVNAPVVTDKFALRLVGHYDYSPGWVDNASLGKKEANHGESYGGRVVALWKPQDDFELVATAGIEANRPYDSAYVPYGSGSDTSTFRVRTYNNDTSKIFSLNANYSLPWATLTSTTSHISRRAYSSMDLSGFANVLTGLTTVSPLIDKFRTKNFLQEVRLASDSDHPFKWVIGGFYENYDFKLRETISQEGVAGTPSPYGGVFGTNFLEDIGIQSKIEDYAVFGEASYDITPSLMLTAGARYSNYSIKVHEDFAISGTTLFDGPPAVIDRKSSNNSVTPKVSLSFKPSKDFMLYALAAKGYRTGNSNLVAPIDPFTGQPLPQSYDPDSLWNYEIGTKFAMFDRRLTVDFVAFYIDWKKIQLQVRAPSGLPYTDNAGSATSKGLELQVVARPVEQFELGTSLAYTDAKLKSVKPGVPGAKVGDQLPGSTPFTAYVYGQYGVPVGADSKLLLRMDYSYTGRGFSDLGNDNNPAALRYGKYSELGARATLRSGNYQLGLFVQNLTNSRGRIAARTYFVDQVEIRQMPRTIGVNFRVDW
ncbi:TonB-dependent receptor [Sphingopyxis sp. JAI128]|uniref:TonB-dependent receptor n=1 Tax=Sphingopyxis sp. JAI128 TaxID=2723066 RepID=UPI0016113D45|nr:TonB-dependent receptor [Sphingopyxis sp. JAI128]MBB6427891.1 outer membrane receptor protein involved in Fe transport [Sphingopyxis sp. JAI128]